jgi:ABC-2 type transport system ATP-binding protein
MDEIKKGELLRCESMCKQFGSYQVLTDISFAVHPGEILGIIGPNGAGKTTLMECLTGLLPVDKGIMHWQNQQISPGQSRQFMFYLPDAVLPYAEQRVEITINFFRKIYGAKRTRLEQLIRQLELAPMLKKQVHSLSKGFRRRLLLLIGLLSPQPLLMLDEPFDGFDLRQTLGVIELLRKNLNHRTLLLSIHQLTEAERICDRFLLLNRGKVSAIGSLGQLQRQAGVKSGGLEEVFLALV